jgi:hypothetical protein
MELEGDRVDSHEVFQGTLPAFAWRDSVPPKNINLLSRKRIGNLILKTSWRQSRCWKETI